MYIDRSPNRAASAPDTGAKLSRMKAKADTTTVASVVVTPKLFANWGRTGATMPYPSETTTAAATKTQISRGS